MNQSTSELQIENRDTLLTRIREWEKELDELIAENGQVVMKAQTNEDKKLVDHFENQFAIQKNLLDKMKHRIKLNGSGEHVQSELNDFGVHYDKMRSEFVAFSESLS
jgi:hypothetical protein